MPDRIQRQRTKGWRLPDGAVYVGRPTVWGNPFAVRPGPVIPPVRSRMWDVRLVERLKGGQEKLLVRWDSKELAQADATGRFRHYLEYQRYEPDGLGYPWKSQIRSQLVGRDLCCWCPLDQPCHADVLLELANG